MYKIVYILFFIPLLLRAQDTARTKARIEYPYYFYNTPVKAVKFQGPTATLVPARDKVITLSGNFIAAVSTRTVNKTPALQNEYVQGEAVNGSPVYKGPETNELFSYGPPINSSGYDGPVYSNILFRRGYYSSQSFFVKASLTRGAYNPLSALTLNASHANESLVLPSNKNTEDRLAASLETKIKKIALKGSYTYFSSQFSNDNTNGYLNRVYENALLTPISFNNRQNTPNAYSSLADNPWALLKNIGQGAGLTQQTGSLTIQKKQGRFNFDVATGLDEIGNHSVQPTYSRKQDEKHYSASGNISYNIYLDYNYNSTIRAGYVYHDDDVKVSYPSSTSLYHYSRVSNEGFSSARIDHSPNWGYASLIIGDKFFHSTTSSNSSAFLPDLTGLIAGRELFHSPLYAKLTASLNSFYSEPKLNHSYAPYTLTQLSPQQSFSFMPTTEAASFSGLSPIKHQELSSRVELEYYPLFTLYANFSIRTNRDVPFPVYQNNQVVLKNLADTRYKGLDITLSLPQVYNQNRSFTFSNNIAFYKYSTTVTRVYDGEDSLAIAGFSTVHTSLVKGKPLAVIMGSSWQRDAANRVVIGPDGLPQSDNRPTIIGNPAPDYTIKLTHIVNWKKFAFELEWEYQKGGDVWNGTEAVLDYYGRSAITASERNVDPSRSLSPNRFTYYGYTGVAEAYIQKADNVRIHLVSLAYTIKLKKYLQQIKLLAYSRNLILWSAYKGGDPNQRLFDQAEAGGLDLFNLPSTKDIGFNVFIQF